MAVPPDSTPAPLAPPHVWVVTTSYPSAPGDPAGHFVEAEVRALEADGAAVAVIRPRPGGLFGWPGVAARLRERKARALDGLAWAARATLSLRRGLAQDRRARRTSRVVAHWALPSALVACAAGAGARGAELEIVSHGTDVRWLVALPRPLRGALVREVAARAARWRFVSATLRDELVEALPEDARAALARVACVEAPALAFPPREALAARARALRAGLGDATRPLYVVAARLVPDKRVACAVAHVARRAAGARGAKAPPPWLVVLGDGPERASLEAAARDAGLDARFEGVVPRDEALAWIDAADALVHASRSEGLSSVVREAEALGTPVEHPA